MNTYLTVGVPRIQPYLARSRRLRARARASGSIAALSRRYSASGDAPTALTELLGGDVDGWRFNDELGKIDGAISLVHPGQLAHDEIKIVAERVLHHLRDQWPGADLNAVWGSGSSYVDAYQKYLGPALASHGGLFSAAPVPELPLARPCQLCEQDAAVIRERVVDEELELCADCRSRGVHLAGGPAGQRGILSEELAGYGDPEDDTHLGTVLMDGNAIGRLFDSLAGRDSDIRHGLSKALSVAVQESLRAATEAITAEDAPGDPTVVHIVGGDDVLVSVPAERAWRFTRQLLAGFEDAVRTEIARLVDADPADPGAVEARLAAKTGRRVATFPSASAGLVVHRLTHPFALVVEAAQARLVDAKQAVSGREAAVAWTHLTIDGDRAPGWRRPWPLVILEQASERLSAIHELPASARHAAARLIDPDQPATSWCRLAVHVERFGREHDQARALDPFLEDARRADDPSRPMMRLLDALTIARWW